MSACFEEVIGDAEVIALQHFLPDAKQLRLQRRTWCGFLSALPVARLRQCGTIELAVLHERQTLEPHQRRWHHVARQTAFQHASDGCFVELVTIPDHIADYLIRTAST